jgi:hypothetical protein
MYAAVCCRCLQFCKPLFGELVPAANNCISIMYHFRRWEMICISISNYSRVISSPVSRKSAQQLLSVVREHEVDGLISRFCPMLGLRPRTRSPGQSSCALMDLNVWSTSIAMTSRTAHGENSMLGMYIDILLSSSL